jgi:hypothetical protein
MPIMEGVDTVAVADEEEGTMVVVEGMDPVEDVGKAEGDHTMITVDVG